MALKVAVCMAAIGLLAGCMGGGGVQTATPDVIDGRDVYGYVGQVVCGPRPVVLTANRMDVSLSGDCRTVIVQGAHNDVVVNLVPGGSIEVTGGHNDITWHEEGGARVPPVLLDHGESNSFHAGG